MLRNLLALSFILGLTILPGFTQDSPFPSNSTDMGKFLKSKSHGGFLTIYYIEKKDLFGIKFVYKDLNGKIHVTEGRGKSFKDAFNTAVEEVLNEIKSLPTSTTK